MVGLNLSSATTPELILKNLVDRQVAVDRMCDQCYSLSLARFMLKPQWSPLYLRRLVRESAVKLCDHYRALFPHRGPSRENAMIPADSIDDLNDVAMIPPPSGSSATFADARFRGSIGFDTVRDASVLEQVDYYLC